jgi:type IV secretion system protein VirB10
MASSPDNTGGGLAQGGNPYQARLEAGRVPEPDLDAGAPQLKAIEARRLNRRAIGFLGALVALMVLAATWTFNNVMSGSRTPPKKREEVVTVPAAPKPLAPPPQVAPVQPKAEPIAVAPLPMPKPQVDVPRGPSLMERRMMDSNGPVATGVNASDPVTMYQQQMALLQGGQPGKAAADGESGAEAAGDAASAAGPAEFAVPTNSAYKVPALAKTASAQPLVHPNAVMTRGTYLRCVLETRLVTDAPGFTTCILTEPVYSFTGKQLLLPKGSKVLGRYDRESDTNRVSVIWDRVITPTGIDVNMASVGIDTLGSSGHPGYRDAHWGERIGAALLISILSDAFGYEAAKHSPAPTTTVANGAVIVSPWQSNTAQTLQNLAGLAVRKAANRPDTITINQGEVVYIYVTKDIDFSGVVARS